MGYIDRADWHFNGDFPEDLPEENGGTHIGMYLQWAIENDLISDEYVEHTQETLEKVKAREINGRDYLFDYIDGKLSGQELTEEALAFTKHYYVDESGSGLGDYLDDYIGLQKDEDTSIYAIEFTWENYEEIAKVIDTAFKNWKENPAGIAESAEHAEEKSPWWKLW